MSAKPVVAYIAVGSNIESERHIAAALETLAREVRVTGISTFYRSPAIDRPEQPDYLNGVVRIETRLSARDLKFGLLRRIESNESRARSEDRFAARTIDLDLALYGDLAIDAPDLTIPDPDVASRGFVSVPLLELDPDLMLPGTGERIADRVSETDRQGLEPRDEFTQDLRRRFAPEGDPPHDGRADTIESEISQ
ncbi:2-amino-4-hydroxy-6-hydroxymethyldihydropteridine diphosphokinase [Candidatus Sumerlaeota bacterium]|nr:2-amino-4-hydroxy-6-hydroxymethyldihydropteridine diphosphokinase [Candidatus Sumerlaeota bacterium]